MSRTTAAAGHSRHLPDVPAWSWRGALLALVIVAVGGGLGLIAGGQPLAGIGLAVVGLLSLGVVVRPEVATLVVVAILYSNAAVIAVKLHGIPVFIGAAVPLMLVAPLAYLILVRRRPIVTTPALPFIFGFLIVQILGTLFSRDPLGASDDLVTFATEGIALYFLLVNVIRSPGELDRIVWVLLAVGAFLGGLSVLQEATKTYSNDYLGFAQLSQAAIQTGDAATGTVLQPRLAGPIGEKNFYAQIMLMLVPLGFVAFWSARRAATRLLAAGATVLISLGVALTFSRGAAVGFVIVFLAMVVLRYVSVRQLASVALAVLVVLAIFPQYAERLTTLQDLQNVSAGASGVDTSLLSRATENGAAILAFIDHPIIGVGPGLFPSYYREYAEQVGLFAVAADRQAHSLYFGTAAETGILGIGCFLLAIAVTLRDLARVRRRWLTERPELAHRAVGLLLSLVAYLATGTFLHSAYLRYFWLVMALAGALIVISAREDRAARSAHQLERHPAVEPGVAAG